MLIKFKRLIVSVLEMSSKLTYFHPSGRSAKISQNERP
ncbi:Uncharacterised protein [Segatella buccae]|uniref:Uncharacterized protein n=1 Tax=Segatella buccae TaxID=28126 RepID=A0AAQ1UGT5_9BACT|nr:Uncharacterised protein [Segatella buccae]